MKRNPTSQQGYQNYGGMSAAGMKDSEPNEVQDN